MKIEFENEKIIVYLYRYDLTFDDVKCLNKEIKNIFIKLVKIYNLKLDGYLKVIVYVNKKYGYILEIENLLSDYEFSSIDLKLIIEDDIDFYFKTDNYDSIKKCEEIYYNNGYFYVNIEGIDNIVDVIEFGDITYKVDTKKMSKIVNTKV